LRFVFSPSLGLVFISNANPACSCVYICKFQFRPIHPPPLGDYHLLTGPGGISAQPSERAGGGGQAAQPAHQRGTALWARAHVPARRGDDVRGEMMGEGGSRRGEPVAGEVPRRFFAGGPILRRWDGGKA
jgi:hypothetical protein